MTRAEPATLTAPAVPAERLRAQAEALERALAAGGAELEPGAASAAHEVIRKVAKRTAIAGGHTVVALAGATGSGKSSLFNALIGQQVAAIGARRPTTSAPAAAIWGPQPANELLAWLGVKDRHLVAAQPQAAQLGSLDGLVLLDLPDFDSRVHAHREESQRLLKLVDVFVWVTDPQKYADALLHDDYVKTLATHDAVTLVVLNQVDRLDDAAAQACLGDLRRLLVEDGLVHAQVLATSARTGSGVDALHHRMADAVAGAHAARQRLSADLVAVASALRGGVGDHEPSVDGAGAPLVEALSRAAGVPVVLHAVGQDYRREAASRSGWLFTRWVSSFRPDPLARLRLDKSVVPMSSVHEADVRSVLGRSSIPAPSPSARAGVSLATNLLTETASRGLPPAWADAVHRAAPGGAGLADALDQAVMNTPLRARAPLWWRVMGALQWILGLAAVVGAAWLTVLGVVGWLQLPELPTPQVGTLPVPFLLLGGGLLVGLLLAGGARLMARAGASRRERLIGRRMKDAIAVVAQERIVTPIAQVLERHRVARESLERTMRP